MLIYVVTFLISILSLHGSIKIDAITNKSPLLKFILVVLIFVAILVPSLLAGLRDYSIGTDVLVYGNTWFQQAIRLKNDPALYLKWATSSSIGYLYALFNLMVARFTDNPHFFYFWYSFAENALVYWAIKRNKDIINVEQGWVVYLFLFYNSTLNILRNGMALIIILWGYYYVRHQEPLKYGLTIAIAYLFHNTAIIAVVVYFIYAWLHSGTKATSMVKKVTIVSLSIIAMLLFTQAVQFLIAHGVISSRYLKYVQGNSVGGGFLVHTLLLSAPAMLLYLISDKKLGNNVDFNAFECYASMMLIFGILSKQVVSLSRFTLYFDFYLVLSLPFITRNGVSICIGNKKMNTAILLTYVIVYWIIVYVLLKSGETFPYVFMES